MVREKRLNRIKEHFDSEAEEFDENILKIAPRYKEMLEALVLNIPFDVKEEFSVLDLGCGTGTISLLIKNQFPNSKVTGLDFSEKMLKTAEEKLRGYENVGFVLADYTDYRFSHSYDVIVSSLTLHHLEYEQKEKLYPRLHDSLKEKGMFITADLVDASTEDAREVNMFKWEKHMEKTLDEEEIQEVFERHEDDDRPMRLVDELDLLKEAGFQRIDVFWKYYSLCVYGARK